MNLLFSFLTITAMAQKLGLDNYSRKINQDLPEVYDHMTKLIRTRVENQHLHFDFIVNATREEFVLAFPKVKSQVLKTVCHHSREGKVLRQMKAPIVYHYENLRGQSMGEFMVKPDHCAFSAETSAAPSRSNLTR